MRYPQPSSTLLGYYQMSLRDKNELTGLIVTALAVRYTKSQVDAVEKRDFDYVCNEIQSTILDRLNAQEQLLRGTAAFFEHSDSITWKEWCRFAKNRKIEQQLPGIQGIGFALLIPRQQLNDGLPFFTEKPSAHVTAGQETSRTREPQIATREKLLVHPGKCPIAAADWRIKLSGLE